MDFTEMMQVINHNPFALRGMFDSREYVFPPETPVTAPFAAVKLIFGYGLDRKDTRAMASVLNNLKLLKLGGNYEEAYAARLNVEFRTGKYVFETPKGPGKNEEPEDEPEPEPEQPKPEIVPSAGTGVNPGASRSPGGEPGEAVTSMTASSADLPKRPPSRPRKRESFEELKARLGQGQE